MHVTLPPPSDELDTPAQRPHTPTTHRAEAARRRRMLRDLEQAEAQNTLNLVFRPRLLLGTGQLWGAETTLRWPHRRHGLQGAGALYDLAGSSELACRLTDWTLRHACATAAGWSIPGASVSVRMMRRHWARPGLAGILSNALAKAGLAPSSLELRLPERDLNEMSGEDLLNLSALRDLGVELALEHFGEAVGSLAALRRLPVSAVTLAPALLRQAAEDAADATLLHAVIKTARARGLSVIACGVEREDQLAALGDSACTAVQGGLFASHGPSALLLPWHERPSLEAHLAA